MVQRETNGRNGERVLPWQGRTLLRACLLGALLMHLASCGEDKIADPAGPDDPPLGNYDSTKNTSSLFLGFNEAMEISDTIPTDSNLTIMFWIKVVPGVCPVKAKILHLVDYNVTSESSSPYWLSMYCLLRYWTDTTLMASVGRPTPKIRWPAVWTHFAIVRSSASQSDKFYLNGTVIQTDAWNSTIRGKQLVRPLKRISFGALANRAASYEFTPFLACGPSAYYSNILIYDAALSDEEVQRMMTRKPNLASPAERRPVVYLDCNGSTQEFARGSDVDRDGGRFIQDVPF